MQHQVSDAFVAAHPASLWTAEVKVRFLDCLSQRGNVRLACRAVGLSAETAYRQRRRDGLFARGWAAAMALARKVGEQVLADRAIDGIEEDVWFRGELVGTRRRHDSRLLLAHLGRLDKAVDPAAERDADRFDELLAVMAGEEMPGEPAATGDDPLPDREAFVEQALEHARAEVFDRLGLTLDLNGEIEDEEGAFAYQDECEAEAERVIDAAHAHWDDWLGHAHAVVDAVLSGGEAGVPVRTVSTLSTPCLTPEPDGGQGAAH